ncbi:ferritin-like domain-containing protein [Microtetraspora niveoalba]|uniref:ferritin-like domain-containing protein n=1 Tax=Microtetraspora niveoalba TaxID=46175 RepID=UPI00082F86D0|nr:ferritin-like domain-containing protein [Microtetraspora niveoalba]
MNDPLAKVLAAEHAAVYAYGVVGAKTAGALHTKAVAGFDAHRARRDRLRALIVRRGGTPPEPGPTYPLPFDVKDQADAVRLASLIEERVVTAYLELAADGDASLRRLAAQAMQEGATRAYGWQPAVGAFPGMPAERTSGSPPVKTEPTPVPAVSP